MSLELIIQQTITGLENQFVSENLRSRQRELAVSLTDERLLATQLANHSDVYSFQVAGAFKVFSLIGTNVSDSFGRAGFYAIRIYVAKEMQVNSIHGVLNAIGERYLKLLESHSSLNENFADLLNSVLIIKENQNDYIFTPAKEDAVVYLEESETIDNIFRKRECSLFNKVYVFQKGIAVDVEIALRQGMVHLQKEDSRAREINLSDPENILKEVAINGQKAEFNRGAKEFTVLCWDNDRVTYNTIDDNTLRAVAHDHIIRSKTRTQTSKPKNRTAGARVDLIIAAVLIVVLAGGVWYFLNKTSEAETNGQMASAHSPVPDSSGKKAASSPENKAIVFTLVSDTIKNESDQKKWIFDSAYRTQYPKLDKYRFVFKVNQWRFKNIVSKNSYEPFDHKTVNSIFKKDTLPEEKKQEFIAALENVSSHPIRNFTPFNNPPTTIIKKTEETNLKATQNNALKNNKEAKKKERKIEDAFN